MEIKEIIQDARRKTNLLQLSSVWNSGKRASMKEAGHLSKLKQSKVLAEETLNCNLITTLFHPALIRDANTKPEICLKLCSIPISSSHGL